jgi:hypothetical protein
MSRSRATAEPSRCRSAVIEDKCGCSHGHREQAVVVDGDREPRIAKLRA